MKQHVYKKKKKKKKWNKNRSKAKQQRDVLKNTGTISCVFCSLKIILSHIVSFGV